MSTTTTLEAIVEPHRRQILDELCAGEHTVTALVERLKLSQPAVSKHLRVLRDSGLVDVRVNGPQRLYRLRLDSFVELDAWLEPYRAMWRLSLDRLDDQVHDARRLL